MENTAFPGNAAILNAMNKLLFLFAVSAILLLIYALAEARLMRVKNQNLYSKKLPPEFDGFRIAFVSDIHNISGCGRRTRRMVRKINALEPDVVLLGGDYNEEKTRDLETCFRVLSEIKAPKYGVLGNHDYYYGEEVAKAFMKKYGIESINNRSVWIRRSKNKIKIGGFDDWWLGYPYPESFFHDVHDNDFAVLVCHNPDYFEKIDISRVSLALAGHHHGGQCSFFGLWAPKIRSEYGMKYCGKTLVYPHTTVICSNGIGTSHIPVRFTAVPEINFITLHSEEKALGQY